MRGFGWRYAFVESDWATTRDWLAAIEWADGEGAYLTEIIDSVIEHGANDVLALTTSMHDLVIAPKPADDPPLDVVVVRAPSSMRTHPTGTVVIEHLAVSGKNTSSERPAAEALPLFWRYIETEFGIKPNRPASE